MSQEDNVPVIQSPPKSPTSKHMKMLGDLLVLIHNKLYLTYKGKIALKGKNILGTVIKGCYSANIIKNTCSSIN